MRRAFTLIEMMVVIAVLTLMAAFITPNLVALQRSRVLRSLEASVLRLPAEARAEAQRSGGAITLRVDDDVLVLERKPAKNEDPVEVKRLPLSGEITAQAAETNGEGVDLASWTWTVYPDGTSKAATLQLQEGRASKILIFSSEGEAQWGTGREVSPAEERWQAGELEQRA